MTSNTDASEHPPKSQGEGKGAEIVARLEDMVKQFKESMDAIPEIVEALEKFLINQQKETATYIRTVVAVGYIGLFTSWGFMKSDLAPWAMKAVAISITISLAWFVIREVANMAYSQWAIHRLINGVSEIKSIVTEGDESPDKQSSEVRNKLMEAKVMREEMRARFRQADLIFHPWGILTNIVVLGGCSVSASVLIYSFLVNVLTTHR